MSFLIRLLVIAATAFVASTATAADPWLTFPGGDGPGQGKHIVLISGDEEYRSEEMLPQMAKILSKHHGFRCTVLFAIDPKDGTIQPNVNNNIPGLEALKTADLMVLFTRFRNLPDDQMAHVIDYVESGKPVVGFRTATHAFNITNGAYKKYTHNSKDENYLGGFGKQILGETWVAHHGNHGKQGTRGIIVGGQEGHGILKGIDAGSIFGTTDVYTVKTPLPGDSVALVMGETTETLKPDSSAVSGKSMMPVAWTKTYKSESGKTARVFTTTMGCSQDFEFEGTRRMSVNACYWALGLEAKIPAKSNVELVGTYKATPFRGKKNEEWKPGVKPEDLK